MSDTRSSELSAQRIAQETAALLKIADNEREYREHVLVALAELKKDVASLKDAFKEHTTQDDSRFGSVNQKIGDNSSWINKGIGMAILFVAMIGFMMWLIDRATP